MNKFIINCLIRKHGSTPPKLGLVEVSHPLTEQDPCKDSPSHHKPTTFAKQVFTLMTRKPVHTHDEKRPVIFLEKCARVYCYFGGLSIVWQKLYKTRDQKRMNQWRMVQLISRVTCSLNSNPSKFRPGQTLPESKRAMAFVIGATGYVAPTRLCGSNAAVKLWVSMTFCAEQLSTLTTRERGRAPKTNVGTKS